VHGQVNADSTLPVRKSHDTYSADPANLAHQAHDLLVAGFTEILAGCRQLLKPEGILAVTARPYRRRGFWLTFPARYTALQSQPASRRTNDSCACWHAPTDNGSFHEPPFSSYMACARHAPTATRWPLLPTKTYSSFGLHEPACRCQAADG
jgi:hypothetical protein